MGLFDQNQHEPNAAAKAVRAYLAARDGIEASWSDAEKRYLARPSIAEWYNGRERGYVVSMCAPDFGDQLNIAFFEHRSSDAIQAIVWEQNTYMNPPCLATMNHESFKENGLVTQSFGPDEALEVADWIIRRLNTFWAQKTE